ncbi:hypothetical protein PYCCODRAFT_1331650, partial [Trametes coccinea BRFM310]
VPVPIGPPIPRHDRSTELARFCRLMLILFKPWRTPSDLKSLSSETDDWVAEFESYKSNLLERHISVMENMQLLHECRDSRD